MKESRNETGLHDGKEPKKLKVLKLGTLKVLKYLEKMGLRALERLKAVDGALRIFYFKKQSKEPNRVKAGYNLNIYSTLKIFVIRL